MKFINRHVDLASLNKRWAQKKAELFILYGKRRVGKTELIKQFIKNKPSVYFLADKRSLNEQLKELGRLLGEYFKNSTIKNRGFQNWLEVFQFLKENVKKPFVVAVDEYPYLVEVDKSISSVFQKGWDEYLKNLPIFFIISGSSVSVMESEALIYKSPLYGRRTGQLLLKPLSFFDSFKFFPKKKFVDFLSVFAVTGGLPAYLLQFDSTLSLEENITSKIFTKTEFLFDEVEFQLKEELREPKNYLSILKAISFSKTKFGEIIDETGMEKNVLHKYLGVLERLQLIEKEVPVIEPSLVRSPRGIYKICDNFFRFWFNFVFPFKSELELGNFKSALAKFRESFFLLESQSYEKAAIEILRKNKTRIFDFEKIGRWWDKKNEIDVVGINEEKKQIIFGEAKWSKKPVGMKVFYELKNKAESVNWHQNERYEFFALFSKSGFDKKLKLLARQEKNVFLFEKNILLVQAREKIKIGGRNLGGIKTKLRRVDIYEGLS